MKQSDNKANKAIIFEELNPSHRLLVRMYVFLGYQIYYIRMHKTLESAAYFTKLFNKEDLREFTLSKRLHVWDGYDSTQASKEIEPLFSLLSDSFVVRIIKKLFPKEDIVLNFKRSIRNCLERIFYIQYSLVDFKKNHDVSRVLFVPSNGCEYRRTDGCDGSDAQFFCKLLKRTIGHSIDLEKMHFPFWVKVQQFFMTLKRRLLVFVKIVGLPFLILRKKVCHRHNRSLKRNYKFLIMILAPRRQFANSIQKVDFLVDEEKIKKEDTLFVPYRPLSESNYVYLEENGLNYIEDIDHYITAKDFVSVVPILFQLFFCFLANSMVVNDAVNMLYFYIRWKGLLRSHSFQKCVSYGDCGPESVVRNILLEEIGCETFYYLDSINFAHFFRTDDSSRVLSNNPGLAYYDYFISWNKEIFKYFQYTQSHFKHYVDLGCFWAEHIRLIGEHKIPSELKKVLAEKGYNPSLKIVSAFDGSFCEHSVFGFRDAQNFCEGLLKLLDDLSGVFLVFKVKKSLSNFYELSDVSVGFLSVLQKLKEHPRCFLTDEWLNSSEIIAASDLTVSFPYGSPSFEALSLRKKALWFDASDKVQKTFYARIPGLVCHNYEELKNRVQKLLFDMSDDAYDQYMDCHIKNRVLEYDDGYAITRFKELLAQ